MKPTCSWRVMWEPAPSPPLRGSVDAACLGKCMDAAVSSVKIGGRFLDMEEGPS